MHATAVAEPEFLICDMEMECFDQESDEIESFRVDIGLT